MAGCWSMRGCDEEMMSRCPHAIDADEKCPIRCQYGRCESPLHKPPADMLLVFGSDADRAVAMKESCLSCEHFLLHGPGAE